MNLKFKIIILFAIILIASFFRLYKLESVPPSPSLDEVSIGYNAYSILKIGVDEYGIKFPIILRAYDDFRPAMHVYLVMPFIALFGLNTLAVRLPAVLLSILTVIATYFLTKTLMKNLIIQLKDRSTLSRYDRKIQYISLIAMFLLAISPWHIYISRLGHEVNAGLSFLVFGSLFFLRYNFILASIFFSFSFISYHPEKIIVPIIVAAFVILYRRNLLSQKKIIFIALLTGVMITTPFLMATFSPNGLARLDATNVFKANHEIFMNESQILATAVERGDLIGQVVHNRRIVAIRIFIESYISHFSPKWLFTNFSNDKHKVPNTGLMYSWEAIFILIGFLALLLQKINKRVLVLITVWILASPLAASISTDAPHGMRAFTMLPMPQILTAFGIVTVVEFSVNKFSKLINALLVAIFIFIISASLYYLYINYYFKFPATQSSSFQYALYNSIQYIKNVEHKYNKIIISNKDNLYQSYMFYLFTTSYDPLKYQKFGGTVSGGYDKIHKFDKYEFRPIVWSKDKYLRNTLLVGNKDDFAGDTNIIKKFYYLDNTVGVAVADVN